MSFSYYRRQEQQPRPVSYGFKQVTARELNDIIKRVSRTTYSAKLSSEDQKQVNNYVYAIDQSGRRRLVSPCGRRSAMSRSSLRTPDSEVERPKRLTEREMSRLLRRLQRPTETFINATSRASYEDELAENYKQGKIVRPKTADGRSSKVVAKYRRPTTASMAKALDNGQSSFDHENKNKKDSKELDVFDYDYSDPRVVSEEEMDFIISRVRQPTVASVEGRKECNKRPVILDEVKIRENLPLLSGLSRSRNVREITERLTRKKHGHMPMATPICIYG